MLKSNTKQREIFSLCGDFPTSSVQPTPFLWDLNHENKHTLVMGYLRHSIHDAHISKMHAIIARIQNIAHKSSQQPCLNTSQIERLLSERIISTIKMYCVLDEKLIYSTRYEPENKDITGIISYDLSTGAHKA
eukprot:372449_1